MIWGTTAIEFCRNDNNHWTTMGFFFVHHVKRKSFLFLLYFIRVKYLLRRRFVILLSLDIGVLKSTNFLYRGTDTIRSWNVCYLCKVIFLLFPLFSLILQNVNGFKYISIKLITFCDMIWNFSWIISAIWSKHVSREGRVILQTFYKTEHTKVNIGFDKCLLRRDKTIWFIFVTKRLMCFK